MALIGINQPAPQQKGPDALDRVAQAFQIAQGALGTALAIPEFLQRRRLAQAQIGQIEAESAPITPEEQESFRSQGLPEALIPRTRGQAKDVQKLIFETPGAKASREKTDLMLQLMGQQEQRAQREEQRKGIEFERKMATPVLTTGEEALDREFAKTYEDWNAQGGFAQAQKNLKQARWAIQRLLNAQKENKNYSGKDVGFLGAAGGPTAKGLIYPEAQAMEEQVQQIVTANLRAALGAQFTEREGQRIFSQTFNPILDEKENATRLEALIKQLETQIHQKDNASKYWEEHGTLKGWKGKLKSNLTVGNTMKDAEDF